MIREGLQLELSTMQEIAVALSRLDPSARARVLRWVQDRFGLEGSSPIESEQQAPTRTTLHAVPQPVLTDEALSVAAIEDMFDAPSTAQTIEAPATSVTGLLTEFVAEFQDIAREWDDACAAPVETTRPVRLLSAVS
jgi:hypothetical protein